jgi:nucleoside-diphosphate-sugar epimerase
MFGRGETRLQPAYVEDVAEAIVRVLRTPAGRQRYELAGPRLYTYQELLTTIAASVGTRPFLVRFPFSLWHVIGFVSETLPTPPITRNQVELMGKDNIPEPDAPGFEALQISPQAIENILPQMLGAEGESGSMSPYPIPTLARAGVRSNRLNSLYPLVASRSRS